tara:strand:- start:1255 stop:1809 length:555 start_codon:yes stop_codon:yes gene_type:complete
MKFFTIFILSFGFIFTLRNNEVFSQSLNDKDGLGLKPGIAAPWTLSISATHMNFAIPKTGNFLSSSINIGYAMKRTSLSGWTGISVMAENGNLYPYFGVSASQPFIKWSFKNRESKPFSLSINEALTCFYHPTWDYFLNITLNPSYSFKSFYFTSWIGYANNLELFKSFMTFGFSVTKTIYSWD